jgi:hypothetical protein
MQDLWTSAELFTGCGQHLGNVFALIESVVSLPDASHHDR